MYVSLSPFATLLLYNREITFPALCACTFFFSCFAGPCLFLLLWKLKHNILLQIVWAHCRILPFLSTCSPYPPGWGRTCRSFNHGTAHNHSLACICEQMAHTGPEIALSINLSSCLGLCSCVCPSNTHLWRPECVVHKVVRSVWPFPVFAQSFIYSILRCRFWWLTIDYWLLAN